MADISAGQIRADSDEALEIIKQQVAENNKHRKELVETLGPVVKSLKFDFANTSARTNEVQMGLVKLFDDILTSSETALERQIKLQFRRRENENEENVQQIVANVIAQLPSNDMVNTTKKVMHDMDKLDDELEAVCGDLGIKITDGEKERIECVQEGTKEESEDDDK